MTADEIRRTVPSIASSKLRVMLAALKHDGLVRECGGSVEWSQCGTCDNSSDLAIRSEAVAVGAAS